ncbi:MAG TPA: inverse autotransporter beta domain-containing protein [Legionella sp.]|nr:inverse autotransporter beta domain-containing protein [Legionella sp.]
MIIVSAKKIWLSGSVYLFAASVYSANLNPEHPIRQTANIQGGGNWLDDYDFLFPFINYSDRVFFANGSLSTGRFSSGADAGVGYRQLTPNNSYILGGFAFLGQYRDGSKPYNQTTLGLEALGLWDFRTRAYLPLGRKNKISQSQPFTGYILQGHKALASMFSTTTHALKGVDFEIGRQVPFIPALRVYAGYYRYGFNNAYESDINGSELRGEYNVNSMVTLTASGEYDSYRGRQLTVGIRFNFGNPEVKNPAAPDRLREYIIRRKQVYLTRTTDSSLFISPENFYYANNLALAGGDGTFERPYQTVQEAELAATIDGNTAPNYVYIYRGSGDQYNLGGQLPIGPNQFFIGSGEDLIYRNYRVLVRSGTPLLQGSLLASSNDYLAHFNLTGAGTTQSTGIAANGVNNLYIQNINISNYTGAAGINGANGTPDTGSGGGNGENGTDGGNVFGINITNSTNISINQVSITQLVGGVAGNGGNGANSVTGTNVGVFNGGNGGDGGAGGNAVGISLSNTSSVALSEIIISDLFGGNGGLGGFGGNSDGLTGNGRRGGIGGDGGSGGSTTGLDVNNSSQIDIQSLSLNGNFLAGSGGSGGNGGSTDGFSRTGGNGGNGGNGGDAFGVNLNGSVVDTSNVEFNETLAAGNGGTGGTGGAGDFAGDNGANGAIGTQANVNP